MCGFGAAGSIVFALTEPAAKPIAVRPRPAALPAIAERPATAPASPAGSAVVYSVVASRNLFSPTRTEASAATAAMRPVVMLPKPNLHGVVLVQGAPSAYLEDPTTKRVAAYRLADAIAGGTVPSISTRHPLLAPPEVPAD